MKLLFLAAGNSIHTIRWVNTLSEKGHDVYLVYLPNHSPDVDKINCDVKLHSLKYGGNKGYYLNTKEIKKIVEKIKPDVINAHYASGYGTLARLSKMKPLLLSVWGSDVYDFPYKNFITEKIVVKNILNSDMIASTSSIMGEQVKKLVNKPNMNIETTPFGVNTDLFEVKKHKQTKENIKIGIVKTLAPKYGITMLISAISDLRASDYDVYLDIYGDGPQKKELEELIKKLNLEKYVKLMGRVPNTEVPKILLTFDIFAVSSIYDSESFGVAVVEAMAAGLPVVASDVDGFTEVVENNVTGFIYPRDSKAELVKYLATLIEDNDKRSDMGEKGRKRVETFYNWDENVKKMESLYRKLVD